MEYRNNPCQKEKDPKIVEIQSMLNKALDNAVLLVKADSSLPTMLGDPHYFQTLHHRNYIPNGWSKINPDGYFGSITENAVKCFQEFLYITPNGIVGETTYFYLNHLASINYRDIKILGTGIQSKQDYTSIHECGENIDVVNIFIALIKPFMEEVADIKNLQEYKVLQKQIIDPNILARDISLTFNKLIRSFYEKMIRCLSLWDVKFNKISTQIDKYYDSIAKKNNGKHVKKVKKYNKNIDRIIENTFKSYTKSKVNIQSINKLIKVTRDGIKFIGKKVKFFEVGACLWKLCDDLNNMSDTTEWQNKWNRDFSDALEAIISLVIGAVVAVLAAFFGVTGTPVIIIGIVVAILIAVIHMILRKFAWYNDLEAKIGNQASRIAKSIIKDGFKSFEVYDGNFITVVYPKKY